MFGSPDAFSGSETLLTLQGVQPFQNVTAFGGVGFQSDAPFDRVVLRGPGDGRFGLDNLRFEDAPAAVPAPGTLALLGTGLAAVAARRLGRSR